MTVTGQVFVVGYYITNGEPMVPPWMMVLPYIFMLGFYFGFFYALFLLSEGK